MHEKMPLYRDALAFALAADKIALRIPENRWYLRNQLWRASSSIPLNIAEGCGGHTPAERIHYYRIARGSGAECSAIFDYIDGLKLVPANDLLYREVQSLGAQLGQKIFKHLG